MMGLMTNSPSMHPGVFNYQEDNAQTLKTRLGEIILEAHSQMVFPRGLLGFPNHCRYALADFAGVQKQHFRVLQSLDDQGLSFIILPLPLDNPLISREDILNGATDLGIAAGDLYLSLIVSMQRLPSKLRITANARAPLFIDKTRKLAAQYVFQNSRYQVQCEIG